MSNSSISTNFSEVNQALISSDMEKLFSLKQTNKEIVTPLSLLSNLKDVGEASYENLESYFRSICTSPWPKPRQKTYIHIGKI